MINIYIKLYLIFLKIGLFSFGGGYAIIAFMQKELIEKHKFIDNARFTDIVAISQVTPGPVSINVATYVGYEKTSSVLGAFSATLGLMTPSIIIMILLVVLFKKYQNNKYVKKIINVLKISVVGLILSAALLLIDKNNFIDYKSVIISILFFILIYKFKLNIILMIIFAGIIGQFIY